MRKIPTLTIALVGLGAVAWIYVCLIAWVVTHGW